MVSLLIFMASIAGCAKVPPAPDPGTCEVSWRAVLAEIEGSQARACASDADCALVRHPANTSDDERLAAHVLDRDRLEALTDQHRARCGALSPEPSESVRALAPTCTPEGCRLVETTLHLGP